MYLDPLHQIHAFPMFLRSPAFERAPSPQQQDLGKHTYYEFDRTEVNMVCLKQHRKLLALILTSHFIVITQIYILQED